MRSVHLWLPLLLLAPPLAPAANARTGPTPLDVPVDDTQSANGTAHNLPIGSGLSEREAVRHAYTMPAVRALIAEAHARGYLPRPSQDRAVFTREPAGTQVFLLWEKPGFAPPAGHYAAPALVVISTIHNAEVRTVVSLSLVLLDEAGDRIRTADEFPELALDRTIEAYSLGVRASGRLDVALEDDSEPGAGATAPIGWRSAGAGDGRQWFVTDHDDPPPQARLFKCIVRYYGCAGLGNAGCVILALTVMGPPQAKVVAALACVGVNTVRCLYDLATCVYFE